MLRSVLRRTSAAAAPAAHCSRFLQRVSFRPQTVPLAFSPFRFCSATANGTSPPEAEAATPPATSASPHPPHPDAPRRLSEVTNVTDGDKELLRRAFHDPASTQPSYAKHPMGGPGAGNPDGDMAAVYTCNICKLRSVKRFSKHSYTKGIVIVQCGGCGSKHLLADHMGWFEDESKTIEEILRAKGEEVTRLGSVHIDNVQKE